MKKKVPPKPPPPNAAMIAAEAGYPSTKDVIKSISLRTQAAQERFTLPVLPCGEVEEQIASELQALRTKVMAEQSTGELQTLQTATEQAAQRQASLEHRAESSEKTTAEQSTGEPDALQITAEHHFRKFWSILAQARCSDEQIATEEVAKSSTKKLTKEEIAGEHQALQTAAEEALQTTTEQAARPPIEMLTKEQIERELQALETTTAAAARDSIYVTMQASVLQQLDEKLTKEQKEQLTMELAGRIQCIKWHVARKFTKFMAKLLIMENALKEQGGDAGELQALQTAMEQATATVKAFVAGFEDSEDEG